MNIINTSRIILGHFPVIIKRLRKYNQYLIISTEDGISYIKELQEKVNIIEAERLTTRREVYIQAVKEEVVIRLISPLGSQPDFECYKTRAETKTSKDKLKG